MANLTKVFSEVLIGFIFIQVVAVVIASLSNFSSIGLIVAGFVDVILMILLVSYVAKQF